MNENNRKRKPRRGICPRCANEYTLLATGILPRHGFTAKGVRHNSLGNGYHIGGHGFDWPIGTAAGNKIALDQASLHDARVTYLAEKPPATAEDAQKDALAEVRTLEIRRGRGAEAPDVPTVMSDARFLGYRHWFSDAALKSRQRRIDEQRATAMHEHREMAIIFRRLVKENPA